MVGATANSSPRTTTGLDRMIRSSRRSPSRGAACGFWIRAWGQREPAFRGTVRLNSPARLPGRLKGGLDIPYHSRRMQLSSDRTPTPDVDASRCFTR